MSCAMLVWATRRPHLPRWCWALESRAPRSQTSCAKCGGLDVASSKLGQPDDRCCCPHFWRSGRAADAAFAGLCVLLPTRPTARSRPSSLNCWAFEPQQSQNTRRSGGCRPGRLLPEPTWAVGRPPLADETSTIGNSHMNLKLLLLPSAPSVIGYRAVNPEIDRTNPCTIDQGARSLHKIPAMVRAALVWMEASQVAQRSGLPRCRTASTVCKIVRPNVDRVRRTPWLSWSLRKKITAPDFRSRSAGNARSAGPRWAAVPSFLWQPSTPGSTTRDC